MRPPVFILGMHRSGTTLLVRLLEELGWFAGRHQDPNAEPWYFLRRNEWLLRRAGGAWDRPEPSRAFLGVDAIRQSLLALLQKDLDDRFTEFVAGGRNATELERPWGVKDPRLSFTLDIWSELFSGSRILLVRRNGIDVARSLVTRAHQELARDNALCVRPIHKRFKAMWHPFEFLPHWSMPTRCFSLPAAFALWEEYVAAAERAYAAFPGEKLAVRYEDILARPEPELHAIAEFCGISPEANDLAAATQQVDPARRLAFLGDAQATEFYASVRQSPWMAELGYDELA